MAFDLEEQEQLAALKAWWKQYGNYVLIALIVILAVYAAWTFWGTYQRKQAEQASQLYYELHNAMRGQDHKRIQRIADDMQEKFGSTVYASMTNLIAARVASVTDDQAMVKKRLKWVVDQGKGDGYKAIARIRLAETLIAEKNYSEAQSMLSGEFPEAFKGMVEDRKGDIYYAQNQLDAAKSAYQAALSATADDDPGKALIRLKLEGLGVAS